MGDGMVKSPTEGVWRFALMYLEEEQRSERWSVKCREWFAVNTAVVVSW